MGNKEQALMLFAENVLQDREKLSQFTNDFSVKAVETIQAFQQTHPKYEKTPLRQLTYLANHLKVKNIFVKDESLRFGLNAFKVLGGIYAIGKYIATQLDRDISTLSFAELTSPEVKQTLGELTFITATDGNHGKGVAWAARELGHKCVVYLPKGAAQERVDAIRHEGADAQVTDGNYDDAVRLAAKTAQENNWIILQDTSWEGYEDIPDWVMQGYASLAKEIVDQLGDGIENTPTHLFLQVGVGSYAASIAAFFANYYKEKCPKIILIEPHEANCYYQSFVTKKEDYQIVDGDLDTIMAGLSCGEPNPKAWEILKASSEGAISADDRLAALGMRLLGHPLKTDARVIAGESGAVPAGVLYCMATDKRYEHLKDMLEINEQSSVVLINTEGDTDEHHYRQVVWEGSSSLSTTEISS